MSRPASPRPPPPPGARPRRRRRACSLAPTADRPARSARYRGKGTDLTQVDAFKKHGSDSGSAEVQVARLSARVLQLTSHLQAHKKDFSTRRGLMAILSQRKQMLLYLQRTDRATYDKCLADLNIRAPKTDAGR